MIEKWPRLFSSLRTRWDIRKIAEEREEREEEKDGKKQQSYPFFSTIHRVIWNELSKKCVRQTVSTIDEVCSASCQHEVTEQLHLYDIILTKTSLPVFSASLKPTAHRYRIPLYRNNSAENTNSFSCPSTDDIKIPTLRECTVNSVITHT